jgi:hypothetical protein
MVSSRSFVDSPATARVTREEAKFLRSDWSFTGIAHHFGSIASSGRNAARSG